MKRFLRLFQMLEDVEKTVSDLSKRLEKTEEALARLEQNVEETSSDVDKLELIESKMRIFNTNMSFADKSIYLKLRDELVYLVIPVPEDKLNSVELVVTSMSEPIKEIERNLNVQLDSIAFYHYFFIATKLGSLIELSTAISDEYQASVRFRLENYDEIEVDLIDGCNIRVSYIKDLNVDARQKLVFDESSSVRFELSILDIIDDYDEYRVRAIASADCRLNDFDDVIETLRTKIESNEQFKRFSRQSEM